MHAFVLVITEANVIIRAGKRARIRDEDSFKKHREESYSLELGLFLTRFAQLTTRITTFLEVVTSIRVSIIA